MQSCESNIGFVRSYSAQTSFGAPISSPPTGGEIGGGREGKELIM